MQRKTINVLAVFMLVSLLGILGLQAYWLKQAIDRSTTEFDQRAKRALQASANKLASLNFEVKIDREMDQILSQGQWQEQIFVDTVPKTRSIRLLREEKRMVSDAEAAEIAELEPELEEVPELEEENSFIVIESITNENGEEEIEIIRKQGLEVIEQAVHSVIIREISRKENLAERLGDQNVGRVIEEKLKEEGIDLPFQYAVYEDSIIQKYSSTYDLAATPYKASIFPDDELSAFLHLGFSSKGAYVLKNTGDVLVLVALFSLLMIGTTVYAIRFMLRQKRLADMKTDFINNMTHEFKTPLATIGLAADSIRHPRIKGSQSDLDRYADVISKESKRLNSHVENLLQLAKMERGDLRLRLEAENINDLIRETIASNRLLLEQSEADLHTSLKEDLPPIQVDAYHLSNALSNLIDNAVKYSEDKPVISLTTDGIKGEVFIVISDRGRGMTEEAKRRAFEAFYREQSGNLHEVKGFGVGLSYVKRIAEAHGGSVELKSKRGKGTTVTLKLPTS